MHVALQKANRPVRKGKARPTHGPVLIDLVILPGAVVQPVAFKVDPLGPLDVELAKVAKVARQDCRTGLGREAAKDIAAQPQCLAERCAVDPDHAAGLPGQPRRDGHAPVKGQVNACVPFPGEEHPRLALVAARSGD